MQMAGKSVFLSYASDDAAAALRICEGLRNAGIDAWFDQSELRGGDAWDQAIRQRVKDCALFLPVISARTNARSEGYFRLEWRLAVERSHLMADDQAFILPVVIDETAEAGARVPDRFRERQWSRLPGGAVSVEFIATVRRLLGDGQEAPPAPVSERAPAALPAAPPSATPSATVPVTAAAASRKPKTLTLGLAGLVVALAAYALGSRFLPGTKGTIDAAAPAPAVVDKSIAVLPFLDMSEKKDQEYFSDGLAEELLDLLAQVPDLQVAARTSSFYFKGKAATISDIAHTLNVAHVLEGSVRKSGDTMRITVQLIRAADGFHLWSQTYDRNIRDVFKVQDEIATVVVGALKARLLTDEQKSSRHLTDNTDAHVQFLLGRNLRDRDTPDSDRQAVDAFERAIRLDPNFAVAYADLSDAYWRLADQVTGDQADLDRAVAAADKAIAMAPGLANGYVARGSLRVLVFYDWQGAQADLDRALALEPSNAGALNLQAYLDGALGRKPEAIAAARRSVALAPLFEGFQRTLAILLIDDGQFDEAKVVSRRMQQIAPGSDIALGMQARVLLAQGDFTGALAVGRQLHGTYGVVTTALAEHGLGHAAAAQQALEKLIAENSATFAYQIAQIYAVRGEKDKAFEWLERAIAQHDGGIVYLKRDRMLASLRADARYSDMLRRLHLPI
jgi:TolB-like protein/tetratricopeptide (TPR) repeat protein